MSPAIGDYCRKFRVKWAVLARFCAVLPTFSIVFVRLERVSGVPAAQKPQIDWKLVLVCI